MLTGLCLNLVRLMNENKNLDKIKEKNRSFASSIKSFFSKQFSLFMDSIIDSSFINLLSVISDAIIVFSYFMLTSVFSFFLSSYFSDLDSTIEFFSDKPKFLLEGSVLFISLGLMLLTYLSILLVYSICNGYVTVKYHEKKFSKVYLLVFLKQNFIFSAITFLLVYTIRLTIVEPIWQILNLLIFIFFVWTLPILHNRYMIVGEKKALKNIRESVRLLFTKFPFFLFSGIIILVVFNSLVMSTIVFQSLSSNFETMMTILVGLVLFSWIRRYMMIVVRYALK